MIPVKVPLTTTFRPVNARIYARTPDAIQRLMMDSGEAALWNAINEIRQEPAAPRYRNRKGSVNRRRASTLSVATQTQASLNDRRLIRVQGKAERKLTGRYQGQGGVEGSSYVRTGRLYGSWNVTQNGNVLTVSNDAQDKWGRFYAILVHGGFTKATSTKQTWFHKETGWRNAYEVLGAANGPTRRRMRAQIFGTQRGILADIGLIDIRSGEGRNVTTWSTTTGQRTRNI